MTLTALQGATAAEQVKTQFPSATLKEFPQQDGAFLEVASGRAQGIVVESYLADGYIAANPGKLKVVPLPAPLQIEYGSWAIPKGDTDFLHLPELVAPVLQEQRVPRQRVREDLRQRSQPAHLGAWLTLTPSATGWAQRCARPDRGRSCRW